MRVSPPSGSSVNVSHKILTRCTFMVVVFSWSPGGPGLRGEEGRVLGPSDRRPVGHLT